MFAVGCDVGVVHAASRQNATGLFQGGRVDDIHGARSGDDRDVNPSAVLADGNVVGSAAQGDHPFHPGGRHWSSRDDPEWQMLADWVRGKAPSPEQ